MTPRQADTLRKLCEKPPRDDIPWRDVVELLEAVGGQAYAPMGGRDRIYFQSGEALVIHRLNPEAPPLPLDAENICYLLSMLGVKP